MLGNKLDKVIAGVYVAMIGLTIYGFTKSIQKCNSDIKVNKLIMDQFENGTEEETDE